MKILTCTTYHYYDDPRMVAPEFLWFTEIPRQMGHQVCFFDFKEQARINKDAMNELLLSAVKGGGFDLVLINPIQDEFYPEMLEELKRHAVTLAWNSDDDYRWEDYSSKWCQHYTYMV
ncbi:MAG: hypothetical protein JRJ85_28130, partial [Deltaproteobacteria bacterium]|nr:hypothetical protein [Deltaproteobacteria bacterium]